MESCLWSGKESIQKCHLAIKNYIYRTSTVIYLQKAFAAKTDNMHLIPMTGIVKEKKLIPNSCSLTSTGVIR